MPKYWFRPKSYGYGATPSTWQGWALSVVGVALVFAVVTIGPAIRDNGLRALWMVLGLAAVIVPFTAIAYIKTEGGWHWRFGKDD
jgi:hypothetical protein